jgi:hypothetical protein
LNWNGGGNINTHSNHSFGLGNSNAQLVQFLPRPSSSFANNTITMKSSLTGLDSHHDNTALNDTLLSSDIGELQISNSSHVMDCSTTSGTDSAEQLTKDIEEFLKSVRSTTQRVSTAATESVMRQKR